MMKQSLAGTGVPVHGLPTHDLPTYVFLSQTFPSKLVACTLGDSAQIASKLQQPRPELSISVDEL